jgi:hypothetical protein
MQENQRVSDMAVKVLARRDELATLWQEDLARKRAEERRQAQQEKHSQARLAAWEEFMQAERHELELRKDGQLAKMLGEPLPGEPPALVLRLASEDRKQSEEGLVALMSDGEVFYKPLEDLSLGDVPARIAAVSSRTAWLKERQEDRWFATSSRTAWLKERQEDRWFGRETG